MDRQVTASTCCYCGVGCGVLIEHDGAQILGVQGDPNHPANFGKLCSKGSSLHLTGDLAVHQPAFRRASMTRPFSTRAG